MTCGCRGRRRPRSCARPTRMPASPAWTPRRRRRRRACSRCGPKPTWPPTGSAISPPTPAASGPAARRRSPRRVRRWPAGGSATSGDPVVLVVAETREQATDAAALVHVEYEPLPAVAATADARRPGAPAVWDEAPDNIAFVWQAGSREAVDRAFAAAAHVTRLDFTSPAWRPRRSSPAPPSASTTGARPATRCTRASRARTAAAPSSRTSCTCRRATCAW